nr:immunoglobulin heavy chain junction region [Mus musculus]MBK4197625.1 immunoglobulin heavy chain junction region [Mus musculus]
CTRREFGYDGFPYW